MKAPPVLQFIKYSLVGFGSLLVHLFIWKMFAHFIFPAFDSSLDPTLRAWNTTKSNLAGFLVGNVCAYRANVRWVFTPGRHSPLVEFIWFSVVGLVAFGAGLMAGPLFIYHQGIATNTAQALLFTTIMFVNFFCRKFLVFQK
ncbi:MAG: GtrA family protein [Prosthecobacter sp.]